MAGLTKDARTGNWLVPFRFGGKKFCVSAKTGNEKDAKRFKGRIEETLRLLELGHLEIPPGANPTVFITTAGKLEEKPRLSNDQSLEAICEAYLKDQHAKADTTMVGERVHIGHLKRTLGASTKLATLTVKEIQQYVNERSKAKFKDKPTSGATIRKELVTFTQIWAWAKERRYVRTECPVYNDRHKWAVAIPKRADKEKFQTWEQIENRIKRGGLTAQQQADLWAVLFLDNDQIIDLLKHVEAKAKYPFIHPMFMFAAYTGARRSEIRRSQVEDFDFQGGRVKIRERKRRHNRSSTFRFVDLHPRLAEVMKAWFAEHPGGPYTIAAPLAIPSRKARADFAELTPCEAHHHFQETLADSKWKVVRGFHALRHSFGSNLARAGVSRDRIAQWMGHTTAEMMELYQHLFPQDGASQIATLK